AIQSSFAHPETRVNASATSTRAANLVVIAAPPRTVGASLESLAAKLERPKQRAPSPPAPRMIDDPARRHHAELHLLPAPGAPHAAEGRIAANRCRARPPALPP